MLDTRIRRLNEARSHGRGRCVIYVMSRDQRIADNHALLAAQQDALERELPLIVLIRIYPAVKNRLRHHYQFMLDGLEQVAQGLKTFNIDLIVTMDDLIHVLGEFDPATVYLDFSPLRGPQAVRERIAHGASYPVYEVDTHNVVPVWVTSDKQEYAARTIRPKIHRRLDEYLVEPGQVEHHPHQMKRAPDSESPGPGARLAFQNQRTTVLLSSRENAARTMLDHFIHERLAAYAEDRNDPVLDAQSDLSPYFHFGQLSSLRAVLSVRSYAEEHPNDRRIQASTSAFIEQIVVRKELADNFCHYNFDYDNWNGLPAWARKTLDQHREDPRDYLYTLKEFEAAATHDAAWNAAQREMTTTGKMHNYMRMYWSKKILEWTPDPETAIEIAVTLNDRYELDGYDPNGYANILWSIGGLHDRPWQERPVSARCAT